MFSLARYGRWATSWARENWRLVPFSVGVWLLWRGLELWSPALASVVLGTLLVAFAVMPYVLPLKGRR